MENRITDLSQLENFVSNYRTGCMLVKETDTKKHPILLEWFLDWFFDEALNDLELARKSFNLFVDFTYICTELDQDTSIGRCLGNLNYWYHRASKENKCRKYKKFKKNCL